MVNISTQLNKIAFLLKQARNIANQEEINTYIQSLIPKHNLEGTPLEKWVTKSLKNYIFNRYPEDLSEVTTTKDSDPDWLKKIIQTKSEPVYNLTLSKQIKEKLDNTIEYLKSLQLSDYIKISVETALEDAKKFEKRKEKLTKEKQYKERVKLDVIPPLKGEKDVYKSGKVTFKQLTDVESLNRESDLMGHCVRDAADYLGAINVYSGRLDNNQPVVTIILQPQMGIITQIQGPKNSNVAKEYHTAVEDFIINKLHASWDNIFTSHKIDKIIYQNQPFNINDLPDPLEFTGDFDLAYSNVTKLPKKITIHKGYLNLARTPIKELPDYMVVDSDLNLRSCKQLSKWPKKLSVGGNLSIIDTNLPEMPDDLEVDGKIFVNKDTQIPKKFEHQVVRK